MIQVVILGTGNVATHLFRAFSQAPGIRVKQIYNHDSKSLVPFENQVSTTTSIKDLETADLFLLALKDDAISQYGEKLKACSGLVAHTSGAVSLEALKGPVRTGVFYPLQTFTKDLEVNYSSIPFCLESSDPKDMHLLQEVAMSLSAPAYEIDSHQRKQLHLSAVFVCNFVNYLYTVGQDLCEKHHIPFKILEPLIMETAQKIQQAPPRNVQTGPARRGDNNTIQAHLDLLKNPDHIAIYELLTRAIQSEYGKKL